MEIKKYECKLPTDGYQPGDVALLTEAYVENANAGETEPRFVLAEDQDAKAVNEPGQPDAPVIADAPVTEAPAPTGGVVAEQPVAPVADETPVPPAPTE